MIVISLFNIAATGLKTSFQKLRTTAHNIANISTPGFKSVTIRTSESPFIQESGIQKGGGTQINGISRSAEPGTPIQTNNPFDLAIDGIGFFQLEKPDGSVTFTRNGSFKLSQNGSLVTSEGFALVPNINTPSESTQVSVSPDGKVSSLLPGEQNNQADLGQITIARFQNPEGLRATGGTLFETTDASGLVQTGVPGTEGFGRIIQGFLESSNVNIIDTQVDLITNQRAFQANVKSIQAGNEITGTIINIKE